MAAAEATSDLTAAEHREQALAARARAKTLLVALAHLGAGLCYDPSHKISRSGGPASRRLPVRGMPLPMLKCPSMKCWLNSRLWQKWYPTDVIGANRQGLPTVPLASTSYGAWRAFPLIDDVGAVQRSPRRNRLDAYSKR